MEFVEYLRKRNESVRWTFTGVFGIRNGGLSVHLTVCSRVVNLIKYPLMPKQFELFEFSTPKCTVTYILTL
jgi:hypothetical protein